METTSAPAQSKPKQYPRWFTYMIVPGLVLFFIMFWLFERIVILHFLGLTLGCFLGWLVYMWEEYMKVRNG